MRNSTDKQMLLYEGNQERPRIAVKDYLSDHIKKKYQKLERIGIIGTGRVNRLDWSDDEIKTLEFLDPSIYRHLEEGDKIVVLNLAMSALTDVVSATSVGAILSIAWQLASCEDENRLIFSDSKMMVCTPKPMHFLETRVIREATHRKPFDMPPHLTHKDIEKCCAYMCTALLRLAVKDEDNLVQAWDYICDQYRNFYRDEIAFRITPDRECIAGIRNLLQTRTLLRNTIGVFLLAFQELEGNDKKLCKMLYELPMCYVGMHAYSLFLDCSARLNAPISEFAALLKHPSTSKSLDTVTYILTHYEFPSEENKEMAEKAKTWRYARLFNSDMFADIQTKNCGMLAGVLAMVSHKIGGGGFGDVTKIRQISGLITQQRKWFEFVADNVIEHCNAAGWAKGRTR